MNQQELQDLTESYYNDVYKEDNEDAYLYNAVLNYLLSEGYADDARSAEVIMSHMSDEWLGDILSEAKSDNHLANQLASIGAPRSFQDMAKRNARKLRKMNPESSDSTPRQKRLKHKLNQY